jgi:5-methylcytosine-specific restriction protein A
MATIDEFRNELFQQIARAAKQGRPHVEINAGELHRVVGGYPRKPGSDHSMPQCCDAMRAEWKKGAAEIVYETESGRSASLTIRYYLPRP